MGNLDQGRRQATNPQSDPRVTIRTYEPGDEHAQVAIYNSQAAALPAFKLAAVEEVERRYQVPGSDPTSKFYAIANGQIVGYAVFSPSGRVSYPWCRPGFEHVQNDLLEAVLNALAARGVRAAWAAYRGDWAPVSDFFLRHGFQQTREMINYVAELTQLPRAPLPADQTVAPLDRAELPQVLALGGDLFRGASEAILETFFWANSYLDPSALYSLRQKDGNALLGAGLLIVRPGYADPTKIDARMPCFRLGALGAEIERHKRVNGLFSAVFASEAAGETLLAEAANRLDAAGLAHAAAQAPSDQPALVAFYDRHFQRQGTFPILSRPLSA
jgi:hypothetical protein